MKKSKVAELLAQEELVKRTNLRKNFSTRFQVAGNLIKPVRLKQIARVKPVSIIDWEREHLIMERNQRVKPLLDGPGQVDTNSCS